MMAQAGAVMVLSRLPSLRCGFSRSLAAFDFTNTMRAGRPLLAVGPIFMRSTSSFSTLSGTSRGSQARCVRASRNSCLQRLVVQSHCVMSFDRRPSTMSGSSIAKTPLAAERGLACSGSGAQPSDRPHLLHVRAEMLEQVLDAVPQRGRRARAARAGAAHVQEHDAVLEAVEDDVAAVVGHRRPHARVEQLLDGLDGILVLGDRTRRARSSPVVSPLVDGRARPTCSAP